MGDNIKVDLEEVGSDGVDWIQASGSIKIGKFFTNCATVSLSRRSLLRGGG